MTPNKLNLCANRLCILFCIALSSVNLAANDDENSLEFVAFKTTEPFTKAAQENINLVMSSDLEGLHLKFEIEDYRRNSNSHISAKDENIIDDFVEVIFDFSGDGNTAYGFRVSANGSINDFTIDNETVENRDWDGIWTFQTSLENDIWEVQIDIPWSTTLFKVSDQTNVDAKFYAAVWQQQNRTKNAFPTISNSRSKFLSNFHPVTLVYQSDAKAETSFTPFIVYDKEYQSNQSDFRQGFTFVWKSQSQALAYAYAPDFGQEKSNELVLNLSAIETFFSEKRRFFLDESELYTISAAENLRIFHSPRIGSFSGPNEQTLNIQHALKYSTRIDNWELGSLISTEEASNQFSGREFAVARVRYSNSGSNLGYLFTQAETPSETRSSRVHTIDFKHQLGEDINLSGMIAQSNVTTHQLEPSPIKNTGQAKYLEFSWDWSDEWSSQISLIDYDKDFDINDAGFVQRVNRKQLEAETSFEIATYPNIHWLESSEHSVEMQIINNQQNQRLGEQLASEHNWIFSSKQAVNFEVELFSEFTDDYLTRGNNPVVLPRSYIGEVEFESSPKQGWLYKLAVKTGKEGLSGDFVGLGGELTYSFFDNLSIEFGLDKVAYQSYLLWDEENTLVDYDATETEFEIVVSGRLAQTHSIEAKLESVALKARALLEYQAAPNGILTATDEEIEDLSIGELAMQIRYHYQPTQQLDLYVIYSRGGEVESEIVSQSSHRLIRTAYQQEDISRLFLKAEYRF